MYGGVKIDGGVQRGGRRRNGETAGKVEREMASVQWPL